MLRKLVVCSVLVAFSLQAVGCSTARPIVRAQSPESRKVGGRLGWKVRQRVEPVWEATKKGLGFAGVLALVGGLWFLSLNNGDDVGSFWSAPAPGNDSGHAAPPSKPETGSRERHEAPKSPERRPGLIPDGVDR